MKYVYYIFYAFAAFVFIFGISALIYFNWPTIKNGYYLHKSEDLGRCYRHYRNTVEFVTSTDTRRISRHPIERADVKTFQVVDIFCDTASDCLNCAIWAKDNSHVYYKAEILDEADPYTFVPLSYSGYSKDHIHVFYKSNNLLVANPESFELITNEFARDNQYVYYKEKPLTQVLHPESFQVLDHYSWIDDSTVYLNGKSIPEADPETFQLVDSKEYSGRYKFFVYKDKDNGYILDLNKDIYQRSIMRDYRKVFIIPSIDNESFEASSHKYYTFDKDHVYFKNKIIQGAIPGVFNILGEYYAMQDTTIYFKDSILPSAQFSTFAIKGHLLGVDNQNVYFEGEPLENADPENIKALNEYYLSDGENVYYKSQKIEDADVKTFTIFNKQLKFEAKDKKHHYRKGKAIKKED